MITLDDLNIDLNMDTILIDYPHGCSPSPLHERTGKAINCLRETIAPDLYTPMANMTSFHTTSNRIRPWIKVLQIFYWDNLRNMDDIDINWSKKPGQWSVQHDKQNRIVIRVKQCSGPRKYTLTFFVTTGTICVQGNQYRLFINEHFPLLKQILSRVL